MPGVSVRPHARRPDALPPIGESLGVQLARRRRELRHTRVEAAALLGVYWKTLRWWEEGVREPTVAMYLALISISVASLGRVRTTSA
jgi:DNA-binding transcriptional regulator YiaG